ncbi:nitric oxide reductase activation protein NorD [Nocardia aobensis]|uniref:Nitric oxide reductase activation protein NorD n=1 Tax=Nocardia aobensis TaxID=257277 RepID=A0ABW6P1X9_9NOCA
MQTRTADSAATLERSCSLTAVALSQRRRNGACLVSGQDRSLGVGPGCSLVHVPFPLPQWTRRTLTCGIALQCAPSKERIAGCALHELTARRRAALTIVEAGVARNWVVRQWPGLAADLYRLLPGLPSLDADLDAAAIFDVADALARTRVALDVDPLLGSLPTTAKTVAPVWLWYRRRLGRMPWSSSRAAAPRSMSVPIGGDGGVRNPNLPPPSRPEDDDPEVRAGRRVGVPYPEWNLWTGSFLRDHVAVVERRHPASASAAVPAVPDLRRWFTEPTSRVPTGGLEDGSDLDIDRYVNHRADLLTGHAAQPRVFRDLQPSPRDVATAVLLDGSSSLGVHHGRIFRVELHCADALSQAMTRARERHGIFVFSGHTRHRVEVGCLKDFTDLRFVAPSRSGLVTGGYTRLGAPVRHLTRRLLDQPAGRRLLLVIGDGLISDEGYEGRYAWADVAHAVREADDAGVTVYYLGVGPTRVDPLPEVFGPRRSQRIRRVEHLPRVLSHVHRELVAD